MKLWLPALKASSSTELNDIAAALAPILPLADAAEADIRTARQQILEYRTVGRWRQHIDKSNGARAASYGALLEVPHQNPDLKLPADYADLFFLHDTSRRGADKTRSATEIAAEIHALEGKLVELGKEKAQAEQREAEAAKAQADREQQEKELANLDAQDRQNEERRKELKKELGKKGKKKK
jgi:hypothetical protein